MDKDIKSRDENHQLILVSEILTPTGGTQRQSSAKSEKGDSIDNNNMKKE